MSARGYHVHWPADGEWGCETENGDACRGDQFSRSTWPTKRAAIQAMDDAAISLVGARFVVAGPAPADRVARGKAAAENLGCSPGFTNDLDDPIHADAVVALQQAIARMDANGVFVGTFKAARGKYVWVGGDQAFAVWDLPRAQPTLAALRAAAHAEREACRASGAFPPRVVFTFGEVTLDAAPPGVSIACVKAGGASRIKIAEDDGSHVAHVQIVDCGPQDLATETMEIASALYWSWWRSRSAQGRLPPEREQPAGGNVFVVEQTLTATAARKAEDQPDGSEAVLEAAAEWAHGVAGMDGFWIARPNQSHADAAQACRASVRTDQASKDVAPVIRDPRAVLNHLVSLLAADAIHDILSVINCAFGGGEDPSFPPGWDGSPIDQEQGFAALLAALRPWIEKHVGLPEYIVVSDQSETIGGVK